jgi:hypothetical protein
MVNILFYIFLFGYFLAIFVIELIITLALKPMPNHLSVLGIIHTAISVFAILSALLALMRHGKINPSTITGKLYIFLTFITCITGFPIMKTGHLTGGHYLGILILVLLPIGIYVKQFRIFGKFTSYLQVVIMSSTLFFSLVPAVIETLTRLPISQPLANGPNAPIIQTGLLTLTALFALGVVYQILKMKTKIKSIQTPDSSIKLS